MEFIRKGIVSAEVIKKLIFFANDYENMGLKSPVWQNLSSCIQKTLNDFPIDGLKVIINMSDVEIFADLLLNKVFYNLVENAIRYGGEQMNTISISSKETDAGLVIVIEDNGAGINEEDKKYLFNRGFGKHTGLGLFFSQEILSITGITIRERGISGKGAMFEIAIPKTGYRFV